MRAPSRRRCPRRSQWGKNASTYRPGQTVTVTCPPYGTAGTVWGTDTYTNDSSVCTAAVHAGLITFERGGPFTVEVRPGQASYLGSHQNGVTSERYGSWDASFTVSAYVPPPPPPPVKPSAPPQPAVISWRRSAVGLSPNGRRFTFVCKPPAERSTLQGVDIYSWDSSICNAAVHAGVITLGRGGTVTIEMRPGLANYPASTRNGITSSEGTRTILSFVFVKGTD